MALSFGQAFSKGIRSESGRLNYSGQAATYCEKNMLTFSSSIYVFKYTKYSCFKQCMPPKETSCSDVLLLHAMSVALTVGKISGLVMLPQD